MTPDAATQRVREAADLVAVAAGYTKLRQRGVNHTGLCPLHREKTPSFTINAEKQLFRCHGCGAGGDVFTFVQRVENLSFLDARRELAERYAVSLDVYKPADPAAARRQQAYAEQLIAECAWFWRQDTDGTGAGCLRYRLARLETQTWAIIRRAEDWLAARIEAPDSPGMEYAWWWVIEGPRIAVMWETYIDQIDNATGSELQAMYLELRPRMAGHYKDWQAFEQHERAAWMETLAAGGAAESARNPLPEAPHA